MIYEINNRLWANNYQMSIPSTALLISIIVCILTPLKCTVISVQSMSLRNERPCTYRAVLVFSRNTTLVNCATYYVHVSFTFPIPVKS